MTNVLVFGMNDNPGGMESFLLAHLHHFDRSKVHLDFLTNCETIAYEDEIRSLGARVFKICARSKNPFRYHKELSAFFAQHAAQYDVLWMNTCSLANIDYLKAAKRYGIARRIVHNHNSQNMDSRLRGLLHMINRRRIQRYATDFWACSRKAGEYAYPPTILVGDRYREIPNAIDCSQFAFDAAVRQAVRAELGLTDNMVIGHIGRLHFQKNQRFLLDVFARVYTANQQARLLIVGQGEEEAMLRTYAHTLGIAEAVLFVGVRQDIPRLLQGMDVFALPSLFEGLPIVLIEAQAAGLHAVVADTVSAQAKLTDMVTFLPLAVGADAWAQALAAAACEPREDIHTQLDAAGYDIRTQAANVQALLTDRREDSQ